MSESPLPEDSAEAETPDALDPDRRIRLIAGSVGVLVFGLIMLFAFGRTSAVDEPSSLLSRRVPPVAGPLVPTDADYPTDQYSIDNHRGQWVLVNFFATWCPPCVAGTSGAGGHR